MGKSIVQIRSKGSLTLPIEVRRKYQLNDGDIYTLIDLGDGSFLLAPQAITVDRLSDRVTAILAEEDISLEEVLQTLDEERQRYYQERYAHD